MTWMWSHQIMVMLIANVTHAYKMAFSCACADACFKIWYQAKLIVNLLIQLDKHGCTSWALPIFIRQSTKKNNLCGTWQGEEGGSNRVK